MMKMSKQRINGFSLVELMVAMVVGLIILSGVFAMHLATRDAQKVNEMQMDMVADARFAIEMISYDLRHAGMWGGTNVKEFIKCRAGDTSCDVPAQAGNDCEGGEWYADLSQPVFASDNDNPYSGAEGCIGADEAYVVGTDVLVIHYADSNVPGELRDNQVYIRANFVNGEIFIGDAVPTLDFYEASPFTENHELYAYAYYISDYTDVAGDGIPSLRRAALVNGPEVQNQLLVSGVAFMQVQFGEDVSGDDEIVNRYVNPADVTDWNKIYSAKIWLVMQSDEIQEGFDTSKSFDIAGVSVDFGGVDKPRFFMVSTVVNLRNLKRI